MIRICHGMEIRTKNHTDVLIFQEVTMKTDEIIRLSIYIITEYYRNNLEPFFEYVSDDIVWIGPARGQLLRGRENLIRTFAAEKHSLTFTMGDIKVLCVSPHTHVKEVLLHYDIYTHYPSGNTFRHDQHLHYTWREKKIKTADGLTQYRSRIVCLHISNAWPYDSRDTIYPVHYENVSEQMRIPAQQEHYITVKASDGCTHRINASGILYIATVKHSSRLLLHTQSGTLTVNGTLSGFEQQYPSLFLRIHSGYLVNPSHAKSIRRFALTLSDGTELPIPEKKYTQVKKLLWQSPARLS